MVGDSETGQGGLAGTGRIERVEMMRWRWWGIFAVLILIAGCSRHALRSAGDPLSLPYKRTAVLGEGKEWRPHPLLVDLNNDRHLDIVATHRNPLEENSLHIWMGDGKGNFSEINQTWRSPAYSALASGDINLDGYQDLVVVSHNARIYTLMGDGEGGFTEKVLGTEDGYVAVKLADLNRDGLLDAVLMGYKKAGIEIYHGDSKGNWSLQRRLSAGQVGRDLAVGDINNDGHLDIAAVQNGPGVLVYVSDGQGGWTGGPTGFYSATRDFKSIALSDVNQDGNLDVVLNGGFISLKEPNGPDVYLGDGKGGWRPSSQGLKTLKSATYGIALGDMDKDGRLDLVCGGNVTGEIGWEDYGLFLFRGDGKGGWTLSKNSGLPARGLMEPYGMVLGDVNEDGDLDIVAMNSDTSEEGYSGYISIWMRQGASSE